NMGKIENIERQIEALSPEELAQFRAHSTIFTYRALSFIFSTPRLPAERPAPGTASRHHPTLPILRPAWKCVANLARKGVVCGTQHLRKDDVTSPFPHARRQPSVARARPWPLHAPASRAGWRDRNRRHLARRVCGLRGQERPR